MMRPIQNQLSAAGKTPEAPVELKQGEVYKAQIKEVLSDSEAVVAIRGKEIRVKFEGNIPESDRVNVQITGKQEQTVTVKEVIPDNRKVPVETNMFKSAGLTNTDSQELKQAVKYFVDKGQPLSKEMVKELKAFFEKAEGTVETKLDSVKAVANKGLEVTQTHLRSIHEALHGKPLNELLTGIAKKVNPNFDPTHEAANIPKKTDSHQASQTINLPQQKISELVTSVRIAIENEPDLKTALQIVKDEIISNPKINREYTSQIEKAVSEAEKLQSIGKERLVQALKNAEVHIAMKDQPVSDTKKVIEKIHDSNVLNNKNLDPEAVRNIEKAISQANQLDQAGRDRLIKTLQSVEQSLNPTLNTNKEDVVQSQQSLQTKWPSEVLKQVLKQFGTEADLGAALKLVSKELLNNSGIEPMYSEKVEKAIAQAVQLHDKGREMAARQHITNELTDIQKALAKAEPKVNAENPTVQTLLPQDLSEQLQGMPLQFKDILITKISQKMAEITHEFRELKRDISRNLDYTKRIIDTYKASSYPQGKQMLENAIRKLDNAILKSDMMLFTDMKTEKQLLQASTQLADAKKMLARGDFSQASKIVGGVKELIDKVIFKPSDQKIVHFAGKESNGSQPAPLENAVRGFSMPEPSARQMFETIRALGLNRDSELANSLVFKNGDNLQQEQQHNLKAVLLKLQSEDGGSRVAQQAEQALSNLTGQQLLAKPDTSGNLQNLLFHLPMFLGGKPENVQVYVNSKNKGQQVDWENCSIYFLLETKKLGDVGVLLSSTDRNLSITIKNDKPGFKEKMESIAGFAKERLLDIGYNIGSIHFTRMTPLNKEENQQTLQQQKPIFTEKGMDFKI